VKTVIHPSIRDEVMAVAAEHNIPVYELIGPHRRRTPSCVRARWQLFARLYDPVTRRRNGGKSQRGSLSWIGQRTGFNHATVLHGLVKMGVWQ
jgi:hypothetical protein